jgi:hypothetical protein
MKKLFLKIIIICLLAMCAPFSVAQNVVSQRTIDEVRTALAKQHGDAETERINRAINQLANSWTTNHGNEEEFARFCLNHFMSGETLSKNFRRIEESLSLLYGSINIIRSFFNESRDFTDTEELQADNFLRGIVPSSDRTSNKFHFFVQLNFPAYSEEERKANQHVWSREKFAMVALGNNYRNNNLREQVDRNHPYVKEAEEFNRHITHYFYRIGHVMDRNGNFLFPEGLLLHGHRGVRDVIKDEYTRENGFERQLVLQAIGGHIISGTMPIQFLENENTRFDPFNNRLYTVLPNGRLQEIRNFETEGVRRYAGYRANVNALRLRDNNHDLNHLERTFQTACLSLEETVAKLHRLLSDPVFKKVGKLIEQQLGRPLQPFDIWFNGFQEQFAFSSDFLDSLTKARYPTPMALENDLPNILTRMGFPEKDANMIGNQASVRPVVSGGYATQPFLRGSPALMTNMFGEDGLDYRSFRIAMHELGHVVCNVFHTTYTDYFILAGVPSFGIHEAYAEIIAYKNMEGLGLFPYDKETAKHLRTLAAFWYVIQSGGQTLAEILSWKWMYENPNATAEEVKKAVLGIADKLWDDYYADIFGGQRHQRLLSIHDHFVVGSLYLHNFFYSNVIMHQLVNAFRDGCLSTELKRSAKEGITSTERWMYNAVGAGVSIEPLMRDVELAIQFFEKNPLQKK